MKRLRILAILMVAIIIIAVPNISLAASEYCRYTRSGEHDYGFLVDKDTVHPHSGFAECICGKKIYYDESYSAECTKCRKELCKKGIHYYAYKVYYDDMFSGYGKCYCGKKEYFSSYMNGINFYEPYPGITSILYRGSWEMFIEANHPHREYDPFTGSRYYKEDLIGRIGNCGVCEMINSYKEEVNDFDMDIIMNESYYDEEDDNQYYYFDEEDEYYDSEHYYDESEEYYEYDDDYYEESEEDDEEFYEWLSIVKDILGSD